MLLQPLQAWGVRQAAPQAPCPRSLLNVTQYPHHSRWRPEQVVPAPTAGGRRMVTAAKAGPEPEQSPFDDLGEDDEISDELLAQFTDEQFGDLENPADDVLGTRALNARVDQSMAQRLAAQAGYASLNDVENEDGLALDEVDDQEEGADLEDAGEPAPGDGKYPARPERSFLISDLFGWAAFYDMAEELEKKHPQVGVYGLQSVIQRVQEGDMYCCPEKDPVLVASLVSFALARGASSLLLPDTAQDHPAMEGVVPEGVPVFFVESVDGAAARLAVAFYEAPSRDLIMINMVGTHGKTTTSWLIRGILEEMQQVTGMIGSIESAVAEDRLDEDGDIWTPTEEDTTATRECSAPFMVTPYQGKYTLPPDGLSALQTQKVLAGVRDRGGTCCLYEPSRAVLSERLTLWVDVNLVVHTLLDLPGVTAEDERQPERVQEVEMMWLKVMEPFDKLQDPQAQGAVVNLDDPHSSVVLEAAASVPVVTYSYDNQQADVVAEAVNSDIWESEIIVRTPLGKLQIITPLLGKHNVYNILAAVATGLALKVPLKSIVAGIEAVEIIPGRCEVIDEGQDFSVIVDGADTPQALGSMLSSLRESAKKNRVITVFGCRGEEDKSMRPLMAEVAHSFSDMVIMTNDSPRREPPESIVQDIVAGLPDSIIKRYSGYVYLPFQDQGHVPLWFEPYLQKAQRTTQRYIMEDRFSAIRAAIGTAAPGDVVVLAGRGQSDFMEYDDGQGGIIRGWFDDRLEARSALSKLAYLNQLTKLDRKTLPWGKALDEMDSLIDPPAIKEEEEEEEPSLSR